MVRDFRRSAEQNPAYPVILFVHQSTVEEGAALFATLWQDARAVADPEMRLYRFFGIERGTLRQLLSPGIVACGIRATVKGNIGGRAIGDPQLMPGLFAIENERVIWHHDFRNAGDHPDFGVIPALIERASGCVMGSH
jgi:hypothetical protein